MTLLGPPPSRGSIREDVGSRTAPLDGPELRDALRTAVERDELRLDVEPIYSLTTAQVVGIECRVGWMHPVHGPLTAERVAGLAHRSGDLEPLRDWTLAALRDLPTSSRPNAGRGRSPTLWLQVCSGQLDDLGFIEGVLTQSTTLGPDVRNLGFQITEPVFTAASDDVRDGLRRLREIGVRLAVGDFGTGSGSVTLLRSSPIDVVKVDVSFTEDLRTAEGRATFAAVIELAHAVDATVVAQGVTTPSQLAELRRMGCDAARGPLFSGPITMRELPEAVRAGETVIASYRDAEATTGTPTGLGSWFRRTRSGTRSGESDAAPLPGSADIDPLTGLGNHRGARNAIDALLATDRRPVLLLLELDGFRALEVLLGRDVTDELVRAQARRLAELPGAVTYHVHDGLFALVLADTRRGHVASQVDLDLLVGGPKGLSTCVGIAHAHTGSTYTELESRARDALDAARRRGSGSLVDGGVDAEAVAVVDVGRARALHAVLRGGFVRVTYEPILSLADAAVLGFVARPRLPVEHALAGAEEAFDVAEQLGLGPELDALCRRSILADGPGFDMPRQARLFLPVSARGLGHHTLGHGQFRRQLEQAGVDRSRVVLEVRESADVPPKVFDAEVGRLAERGFRLALAEAGGPLGGLRALRTAAFDYLKLAPEVLTGAREDRTAAATFEALTVFAQRAGMQVIATGVDNRRLLATARLLSAKDADLPRIHGVEGAQLGKPRSQAKLG